MKSQKGKERQKMKIYLDMDGTIADLYGVENWLENLVNYNDRP